MRTTLPLRPKPTQTDRVQHILHDAPKKKGFAIAHVPPAPYRWADLVLGCNMNHRSMTRRLTGTLTRLCILFCLLSRKCALACSQYAYC